MRLEICTLLASLKEIHDGGDKQYARDLANFYQLKSMEIMVEENEGIAREPLEMELKMALNSILPFSTPFQTIVVQHVMVLA